MKDDDAKISPESKPADTSWPSFPEQNADGIDLSLIRDNLRLTPTERIRRAAYYLRSKNAAAVTSYF